MTADDLPTILGKRAIGVPDDRFVPITAAELRALLLLVPANAVARREAERSRRRSRGITEIAGEDGR